jgi:hypothetical protein
MKTLDKQYLEFLMKNENFFYEKEDYATVKKIQAEIREELKKLLNSEKK